MNNNKKIKDIMLWVGVGLLALSGYFLIASLAFIYLEYESIIFLLIIPIILGVVFVVIGGNYE